MNTQPRLSFWQIWNMSFGFLGIQFGFALQNANVSRILQTLGADVHSLSWFWLAAPIAGLIVQPIVGHYSDRTWGKLGRRRPFFLAGAILAFVALIFMPNSPAFASIMPSLFIAAGMLMFMDVSVNISMEPFRALVADMLPSEQRTHGFSVQSFFIGIGAVVGSALPYMLTNWLGISNTAAEGQIPMSVKLSFYSGAVVFLAAIIWTVYRTKEYPPDEYLKYHPIDETKNKRHQNGVVQIFNDIIQMPKTMLQLGFVQFFSWFALFTMWVYTTPAVTEHIYHASIDPASPLYNVEKYNEGANWVSLLFSIYNGCAALFAFLLPVIARKTSRKTVHALSLIIGGLSLASIYFVSNPNMLVFSMIGVGLAWTSILAMPYAILAGSLPSGKMGIYMGIFNFFIVIPQIINGIFGGPIITAFFDGKPIYAIIFGGFSMLIAALFVLFVKDNDHNH